MIFRTEKVFLRYVDSSSPSDSHVEEIKRVTWYFIFILVFVSETIIKTNL